MFSLSKHFSSIMPTSPAKWDASNFGLLVFGICLWGGSVVSHAFTLSK